MAAASVFDAQINAVDRATGPIRAIANAMRGLTQSAHAAAAASRAGASVHNRFFSALGGHVKMLRGGFGSLTASLGSLTRGVGVLLPMLGGLGAIGSFGGLFALANSAAKGAKEMATLGKQTGLTETELVGLKYAAEESGVSSETMIKGVEKLNKTMGLMTVGKGKDAAALMKHLGISLKDSSGHTRTAAQIMPLLANAFKNTKSEAMKAYMATTLFGKAGQEMLSMLVPGADALNELTEAGVKLSYIASPEETAKVNAFEQAWSELEAGTAGFRKEVGTKLAPALLPIVTAAKDWVLANRAWIATNITDAVNGLAEAARQIYPYLREVATALYNSGAAVNALLQPIGGLKTVLEIAGAAMLVFAAIAWTNPIVLAVGVLVIAGAELYQNWDLVQQKMAAVFEWFARQDGWAQVLITGAALLGAALLALAAVTWANPIVLAVGAVAGAAYLIYEYWEPIKAFFLALWEGIKATFAAVLPYIQPIIDAFNAPGALIQTAWGSVAGFFSAMWDSIKAAFVAAVPQSVIDAFNAMGALIQTAWEPITAFFAALWDGIKAVFVAAVPQSVIDAFNAMGALIQTAWEPVGAFFNSMWDGIKAAFAYAWSYIQPIVDKMRGAVDWVQNSWVGRQIGIGGAPAGAGGVPEVPDAIAKRLAQPSGLRTSDFERARGEGYQFTPAQLASAQAAGNRLTPAELASVKAAGNPVPARQAVPARPPSNDNANNANDNSAAPARRAAAAGAAPPSLYREGGPAAAAAAAPPQQGKVDVTIKVAGAPPGTTVSSTSSGIAKVTETNVGHTNPMPR